MVVGCEVYGPASHAVSARGHNAAFNSNALRVAVFFCHHLRLTFDSRVLHTPC